MWCFIWNITAGRRSRSDQNWNSDTSVNTSWFPPSGFLSPPLIDVQVEGLSGKRIQTRPLLGFTPIYTCLKTHVHVEEQKKYSMERGRDPWESHSGQGQGEMGGAGPGPAGWLLAEPDPHGVPHRWWGRQERRACVRSAHCPLTPCTTLGPNNTVLDCSNTRRSRERKYVMH